MTRAQKRSYSKKIVLGQQKGDLQKVYNFIKQYPNSNFEEIARSLNLKTSTAVGRVSDLHDMGLVEPSDKFKNKSSYCIVTTLERRKAVSFERSQEKMQRDLKRFISHFKNTDEAKEAIETIRID